MLIKNNDLEKNDNQNEKKEYKENENMLNVIIMHV